MDFVASQQSKCLPIALEWTSYQYPISTAALQEPSQGRDFFGNQPIPCHQQPREPVAGQQPALLGSAAASIP